MVHLSTLLALLATATLSIANPVALTSPDAAVETVRLTPCATVRCAAGYTCQATGRQARCVPNKPERRVQCGKTLCASGLTCCNASCNMCTPPGMMCTQQVCTDKPDPIIVDPKPIEPVPKPIPTKTPAKGVKCGSATCDAGMVCCNDSCGICTPPGGACIMLYCGKN